MTAPRSTRMVLSAAQQSKRTTVMLKNDKHTQHGQLMLSVVNASSGLERLLAVAKLAVTFLADMLRRSDDMQDIPLLTLGHYYLSHRALGDAAHIQNLVPASSAPMADVADARGASANTVAGATEAQMTGAGGTVTSQTAVGSRRVYVQELCTFDEQEGPKRHVGLQGAPLAILHVVLEPTAHAKAKRLGRSLSIKVNLQPEVTAAGGRRGSSGSSTETSSSLRVLACGEEYEINWPALLFLDPISPLCSLAFKGDLEVSCMRTGLCLSLTFAKDHAVKGSIERFAQAATPPQAQAPASTTASPATAVAVPVGAGAAAVSGDPTAGDSGVKRQSILQLGSSSGSSKGMGPPLGRPQVLGSLQGSWMSVITASCPQLGLEGVMYDVKDQQPLPVLTADLRHIGPMKVCRLWSALHDALLYADPGAASGGKAAVKLATTMGQFLSALTLDRAAARDVAAGLAKVGTPGSLSGVSQGAPSATLSGTPSEALSVGTDPELEEFDRQAEGVISTGLDTAAEDTRAVPPCYKEQHAAGHKLRYQLHYTLTAV